MAKTLDPYDYEYLWRPVYEYTAARAWFLGGLYTAGAGIYLDNPHVMWGSAVALLPASVRFVQAAKLSRIHARLLQGHFSWLDPKKLHARLDKRGNEELMYLGEGFRWAQTHAQRAYQLRKFDDDMAAFQIPWIFRKLYIDQGASSLGGCAWIHGIEKEASLDVPLARLAGHTIIFGTTGAGKTRLYELIASQAIHRGEPLIIVDPKGDKELVERCQRELERCGRPDDLVYFHPSHASKSVRIDPLKNWSQITEIASRISALQPGDASAEQFRAFGWQAMNTIANAMVSLEERPSLFTLRQYLESNPTKLAIRVLEKFFALRIGADWEDLLHKKKTSRREGSDLHLQMLVQLYNERFQGTNEADEAVSGIIAAVEHNREHYGKMIATLLPLFNMLTSGDLRALLSPDYEDREDPRPIWDLDRAIKLNKVVYIALDSLSNATVGSAIGSIVLADLAAVAGARYNDEEASRDFKPVNVLVDEAAEVLNKPTIQIANKGRGAAMRLFIASQTLPDFTVRLGSEEEARQVLGNMNNLIALRVIDATTQEYCVEAFGLTNVKSTMVGLGTGGGTDSHIANFNASFNERLNETEVEIFPAFLIGKLPDLHFVARTADGRVLKGRLPLFKEKTP